MSYFRFDVPGLENLALDGWEFKKRKELPYSPRMHTIDFINRQTKEYLKQPETGTKICHCAQALITAQITPNNPFSLQSYVGESQLKLLAGGKRSIELRIESPAQFGDLSLKLLTNISSHSFFDAPLRNNLFLNQESSLDQMPQHLLES